MNRTLTGLVLAAGVAMGGALAQGMGGMNMGTTAAPAATRDTGMGMPTGGTNAATVGSMAAGRLEKLSGKAFDRAFLSMMIPHHQAAVEMAQAVLPLTKNATVKGWANAIITAQQREITTMMALLKPLGGSDARMAGMMTMSGMGMTIKSAKNPDVAFVQGMVPHHASAIDMATVALVRSSNSTVRKLAQDIVQAQAKEIYEFRGWLLKQ